MGVFKKVIFVYQYYAFCMLYILGKMAFDMKKNPALSKMAK